MRARGCSGGDEVVPLPDPEEPDEPGAGGFGVAVSLEGFRPLALVLEGAWRAPLDAAVVAAALVLVVDFEVDFEVAADFEPAREEPEPLELVFGLAADGAAPKPNICFQEEPPSFMP